MTEAPSQTTRWSARWGDLVAGVVLAAAIALVAWATQFRNGLPVRGDMASFFVPAYGYLGDALRAGRVPGWNPHEFAGLPFLADPGSGWWNLPVMALFALLPPAEAVGGYALVHALLAGVGAMLLGRALGIGRVAAALGGFAYAVTWLLERTTCCPAFTQVGAWLPLVLLGTEWFARGGDRFRRAAGFAVAAVAFSQVVVSWLGQGSLYVALFVGWWLLWRWPSRTAGGAAGTALRLGAAAVGSAAVVVAGAAVAGAFLLPAIDANLRSLLSGGSYDVALKAQSYGVPLTLPTLAASLLSAETTGKWWYAGGAVLALAGAGFVAARRWPPLPMLAGAVGASGLLTLGDAFPPNRLLAAVVPGFASLHGHLPERALMVAFLPLALIAAAAIDAAMRGLSRRETLVAGAAGAGLVGAGVALAALAGEPQAQRTVAAAIGALAVYAVASLRPTAAVRTPAALVLAVVLVWDPLAPMLGNVAPPRANLPPVPLAGQFASSPAADWLRANAGMGYRFAGFDPVLLSKPQAARGSYRRALESPEVWPLLVGNRATVLGLETTQGYNPSQVRRFAEYVAAMNGHPQEYHEASVFPTALDSPLLDALGVRFLVVPPDAPRDGPLATYPLRHRDGESLILERPTALPRAWIVHDALVVEPGRALDAMTDEGFDPATTVVLEATEPMLDGSAAGESRVIDVDFGFDRLDIRAQLGGDGVLVIGQTFDPGWRASVDGEPARLERADHALMAVPLPAGEHAVTLRYEPPLLVPGLALSALAIGVLAGGIVVAARSRRSA